MPAIALRRPITVLMLLLTLLMLGAIAYWLIPLEFLIGVDFPVIRCWIPYPGAAPQQVENEVTVPAEGEFLTVPHIKRIYAHSDSGGCYIMMRFDWGTDMSQAIAEVRDRVDRLRARLPSEIDHLYLRKFSLDEMAIFRFALFREEDQDELARLSRRMLRRRLMRVDGVAEVKISGRDTASVNVDFDRNALASMRLGIYDVIGVLRQSNLNVSVGEMAEGERNYFVRVAGELSSPGALEDVVVNPRGVRLRDVADVSMSGEAGASSFTVDGKRGVFVSVMKEAGANVVDTCEGVKAELEALKQDPAFKGVEWYVFDDQSEIIYMAVNALLKAGGVGLILALAVLFIFLRRVRATLLVALAIPSSLVAGFVYMYFSGMSLNMVTLASMIVSLGMLVDNSIVVIENIYRHHELDPDPRANARDGAAEVALAITTATLTTIVVFIPVFYMEVGEISLYMREFAAPVSVALAASLFIALTVMPLAVTQFIGADLREHHHLRWLLGHGGALGKIGGLVKRLDPLEQAYAAYAFLLGWSVRHRLAALCALAGLGAATYSVAYRGVGMQELPSMDLRQLAVHIRFDPNYSYERAEKTFDRIEDIINGLRGELGIRNLYVDHGAWGGHIRVFLEQPGDSPLAQPPPYTTDEVRRILAEILPERVPGGDIDLGVPRMGPSEDKSTIALSFRGEDERWTAQLAEDFARQLEMLPEVARAWTDREEGQQELQLQIDQPLAAGMGVTPRLVAQTVDFALRGTPLPYLKQDGQEIAVRAQLQGQDRRTKQDLDNIPVATPAGALVRLNQLAGTHKGQAPHSLRREDGKAVVRVNIEVSTKDLTRVREQLDAFIASWNLPRGYSIRMGETLDELAASLRSFRNALALAVILIYLVMSALFESCLLPLSILTSVPLAFIGVYWAMYLTHTPMDTVSLIGGILMCGVIVNNGIVIVDHINQLRRHHGLSRDQAVLQGGQNRLRPVLMTATTTILGCVPLAIGASGEHGVTNSLGRTLVGGLTMGTFLTLFVVPLFYSLVDDFQVWFMNFFASLARLRAR